MEANSSSNAKPVVQAIAGIEAGTPTIVTHGGNFHADDIWAAAVVRVFFPGYRECPIIRTRDKVVLDAAKADPAFLLLDVGGEYSPRQGLFDHHFSPEPLWPNGKKMATAGMVMDEVQLPRHFSQESDEALREIARRIDSVDTGTKIPGWTLSATLHKCNPLEGGENGEYFDNRFGYLVHLVQDVLEGILFGVECLEAVAFIQNHPMVVKWVAEHDAALAESEARIRIAFEQEGPLLVLDSYEPALMDVASEAPAGKMFSIYPSPGGEWMVQQIPLTKGEFGGRKQLPSSWAGKRGTELDAVTGIEGCVFTHPGRFIGGHKTLEGAKALGLLAAAEG